MLKILFVDSWPPREKGQAQVGFPMGLLTFSPTQLHSIFSLFSYPSSAFLSYNSSFCLLDLIPPCCFHAQVLCTALLHELDIFCSCAGCCLLFTRREIVLSLAEVSYLRKLDYNDSNYNFVIMRYLVANCKRFVIAIAGKYYSFFFIVFHHELSVRFNMNMSYVFSSDGNFHVAKEMFIFY